MVTDKWVLNHGNKTQILNMSMDHENQVKVAYLVDMRTTMSLWTNNGVQCLTDGCLTSSVQYLIFMKNRS